MTVSMANKQTLTTTGLIIRHDNFAHFLNVTNNANIAHFAPYNKLYSHRKMQQ